MKCFFILFFVCAAVVGVFASPKGGRGGGQKGRFKEIKNKCITDSGLDEEAFKSAIKNGGEPEENVKCVYNCMGKAFRWVTEDGTINKKKVKNWRIRPDTPEDKKKEMLKHNKKCANLTGATPCDTSYKIHKCLISKRRNKNAKKRN